jgi:hypothetical protein
VHQPTAAIPTTTTTKTTTTTPSPERQEALPAKKTFPRVSETLYLGSRVTRFGEFSPNGCLGNLGSFYFKM